MKPDPKRATELKIIFNTESDEPIAARIWPRLSVLIGIGTGEFAPFAKRRDRYQRIGERLCSCQTMSEEEAIALLFENTLNYRHKWLRHMVITVWSAVLNSQQKTLTMSAGMDYSRMYRFALDEPCKVTRL